LERTRCETRRSAFRFAAASIGSFEVGVPELPEFIPRRRSQLSDPRRLHLDHPSLLRDQRCKHLVRGQRLLGLGHPTMINDQAAKIKPNSSGPQLRRSEAPVNGHKARTLLRYLEGHQFSRALATPRHAITIAESLRHIRTVKGVACADYALHLGRSHRSI